MKTKNILRTFLAAVFVLGTLAMNAQTKIYVHKSNGISDEYNIADIDSISFAPRETTIDYTKLVLTEVSGNNKFVEIYNSATVDIPMKGVKLSRNDGMSQWTGGDDDVIPAGAYRLFLFNSYTPAALATNPAYTGWTVGSGISSGQTLKVAIVTPHGEEVSVFIRGDENVLLPWQTTTNVSQNTSDTYSLMGDGTWAYADPTPGAGNGAKKSEIANPGYMTEMPE